VWYTYIGKYVPSFLSQGIVADVIQKKNMKGKREKGVPIKCKKI
jgi:hypothetical protein